ncbi:MULTISPECIES: HAMP domain-containing sensor histidine kinase [unclassified Spirosoma]|uniref:sensor histidine kinase n=1 Tax=unclassified Spirosoma TaxID=2621999 RepID=UPI00095A2805|nr:MULTISPECIES: HAMP domain-containing sensor histidine kinase [unclassified Spirosoma]MBN8822215.1 HAMP domain-containing histidine kinase [Spirosoma sp.]OJW72466.1 MAG: two-component sensor histidine kinase [Spirosoma sp. 48-14]
MSLLGQTARYLLLSAFVVALIGSVGFYILIHRTIQREVDEILMNQVEQVRHQLRGLAPNAFLRADWDDNPHIERISSAKPTGPVFSDLTLPNPLDSAEFSPVRQVKTIVTEHGETYQITVRQAYYEFNELARIISVGVIWSFLLLMGFSVLIGLGLSRRLWRPFYTTIQQLGQFQLEQATNPLFPDSRIREFDLLSQSLQTLTQNVRKQFFLQKQFTENASHELQTPLAIALTELDTLMQSDNLREADHLHLQRATDALSRLSQLNRSLLLLTQVENDQYSAIEPLNISQLTNQYTDEYAPFFEHKGMTVERAIRPDVELPMNPQLAGVLLNNLFKNAVRHGAPNGQVRVELTDHTLRIQNTGEPLPFADSLIFNRFVKNPARPDSTGLGLALVKQICDRYKLELHYAYDASTTFHGFQIKWKPN